MVEETFVEQGQAVTRSPSDSEPQAKRRRTTVDQSPTPIAELDEDDDYNYSPKGHKSGSKGIGYAGGAGREDVRKDMQLRIEILTFFQGLGPEGCIGCPAST